MAKKLILLLLIIPIVVMIILFAASDAVANMVAVRVEKIEITNNPKRVTLDFDQNETFSFEYVVTPTGAKNKDVSIKLLEIGDQPKAEFIYDMQPGKITLTPTKVGAATIVVYSLDDDTRKDSFDVYVKTTKLQSIDATISKDVLVLGGKEGADTATITTTFFPENPSNTTLHYESSDKDVVTVSAAGVVRAVGRGAATIAITSDANENITDFIDVVVEMEGQIAAATPKPSSKGTGEHTIDFNYPVEFTEENLYFRVLDANGEEIANPDSVIKGRLELISREVGKQKVKFSYEFAPDFVGDVTIELVIEIDGEADTFSQTFSKVDKIKLDYDKSIIGVSAASTEGFTLYFELMPSDIEVVLGDVIISNPALISNAAEASVVDGDGRLTLKTLGKAGTVTVSLTVYNKLDPADYAVYEKTIEIGVTDIFVDYDEEKIPTVKDSLENILTLGGYEYNGTALVNTVFSLIATPESKELLTGNENYYKDHYKWYSSKPDRVKIDEKTGLITYTDDTEEAETVEFWVSYVYGDKEIVSKKKLTLRCVKDGINVYSFADLYYATKAEGHPIVLQRDIVDDFGYMSQEAKNNGVLDFVYNEPIKNENGEITGWTGLYEKIDTTYDYTYYENIGEGRPQVITLLQFHEDIYGNGHTINAGNVTMEKGLGAANNKVPVEGALFQGPLNFVELVISGANKVSVKAQDNICFAIYDNVTVTDVNLRGCTLTPQEQKDSNAPNEVDLVHLNWVGTTVEVLGTNVNIQYSRLTDGRTVLRAFGDDEDPTKEIELTISNCMLQRSREFLMRIGSNRFVDSVEFNDITSFQSPKLPDPSEGFAGLPFTSATAYSGTVKQRYSSYSEEVQAAYENAYINTFVTVRDSVFMDTAIFAIGMDSHFSGPMLYDGPSGVPSQFSDYGNYVTSWHDLAKTSYGAKLTFAGDVWINTWKDVNKVDSTSLIDVRIPETGGMEGLAMLELNLGQMIKDVTTPDENGTYKYPALKNITTSYEGKAYVHAGIAFFGGGKNYSVIEFADGAGGMVDDLNPHNISLGMVEKGFLERAAGPEEFCFFICSGATVGSGSFSPQMQENMEGQYNAIIGRK